MEFSHYAVDIYKAVADKVYEYEGQKFVFGAKSIVEAEEVVNKFLCKSKKHPPYILNVKPRFTDVPPRE